MERLLEPEILDQLDPADPAALRSRADLRWINRLMGTQAWMLKQLAMLARDVDTVIELGAGEGHLLNAVHRQYPNLRCVGYDLVRKPDSVAAGVDWVSGDFMQGLDRMPLGPRTVVLANLILHHLDALQLEAIRAAFAEIACWLIVEPDRSRRSLWLGWSLLPFVGAVTRADMMTSIRAGFCAGELGSVLGRHRAEESVWLGGRRVRLS